MKGIVMVTKKSPTKSLRAKMAAQAQEIREKNNRIDQLERQLERSESLREQGEQTREKHLENYRRVEALLTDCRAKLRTEEAKSERLETALAMNKEWLEQARMKNSLLSRSFVASVKALTESTS